MLGVVLLINIVTLTACSPSRYPYVFLLDIGNEEIQETKNEQMRVSMGGGSATIRYPAIGDGELITHVRVTSVDFGANLMATVMDGGPGSKYAVIAIAGNKNAPYEVLLSFDTLKDSNNVKTYEPSLKVNEKDADVNDSSEDVSDDVDFESENIKTDQSLDSFDLNGNNVDNVDINAMSDINESDHVTADESNTKYGNIQEEPVKLKEYQQYYIDDQMPSYSSHSPANGDVIEKVNPDEYNLIDGPHFDEVPLAEPYSFDPNEGPTGEEQSVGVVDQNLYNTYKILRPHLADNLQVNSYTPGDDVDREMKVNEREELDQMFNDEDIHNIIPKPENSNNNHVLDAYDTSAVAY